MEKAQQADMSLKPLQIGGSNFSNSQSRALFYPVISFYRKRHATIINSEFATPAHTDQARKSAMVGYYTPTMQYATFSDVLNRINYNFVQLQDVDRIIKPSTTLIPNQHYRLILAILEAGVAYNTEDTITAGGASITGFSNAERT